MSKKIEVDEKLGRLLKDSEHQIDDPDFEDKLMRRIELLGIDHKKDRNTIRISWVLFVISLVLFPMAYARLNESILLFIPDRLIANIREIFDFVFPAGIILFSIVMLLVLDNLLKLSFKRHLT